uniref:RING-CH-type domain-containing protein n=1 Tax=Romanomermis culicivorax TaxID=13658 RepID=A0A915I186_ROMCU
MPKYSLPHENFNREEYGAMCQICGQAESLTTSSDTNRCPLKTSLSSPQVAHLLSKAPRKESATSVRVLEGSVQESSRPGVIASREQGVQVSKWSLSSTSSSNVPLCRICHSPGDKTEPLMSPCRCSGSLQFVHSSCLLRWLDISRRKSHRSPHCELCGYKYQRHKTIRIRKFQCPPCCRRDKFLHVTFILAVLIMFACATLTVISFESQRNNKYVRKGPNEKVELNSQEVITLVCGIMFFCAFFLAMYVQVKAQATIYRWMTRFWMMNQEWEIEEYRPERDPEYFRANKHRLISRYNNNNNVKNDENVNNGSRRPSTKPTTGRQENSDTAATSDDAPDDDRIPRFSTV